VPATVVERLLEVMPYVLLQLVDSTKQKKNKHSECTASHIKSLIKQHSSVKSRSRETNQT
jgi:hypothetical protein